MLKHDLIIVGAGPAGIAAALNARRLGLNSLLLGDEAPGGLLRAAHRIENLPGQSPISGAAWSTAAIKQLAERECHYCISNVMHVSKDEETFLLQGDRLYSTSCIVMACGTLAAPFHIPLPLDARLHRDMRSVPANLAGQRVAVIGAGEAACDSAISACARGAIVSLFHRGTQLHAAVSLLNALSSRAVSVVADCVPLRITTTPQAVRISFMRNGRELSWQGEQLLVCIGRIPRLELLRQLKAEILAGSGYTTCPGVFVAGDIMRPTRQRFLTSALSDGMRAAILAHTFITGATHHE